MRVLWRADWHTRFAVTQLLIVIFLHLLFGPGTPNSRWESCLQHRKPSLCGEAYVHEEIVTCSMICPRRDCPEELGGKCLNGRLCQEAGKLASARAERARKDVGVHRTNIERLMGDGACQNEPKGDEE